MHLYVVSYENTNSYHQLFDLYDIIIYLILVNDENDANCMTAEEIDEMLDKENEVPPAKKQKRTKTGIDKKLFIIIALLSISIWEIISRFVLALYAISLYLKIHKSNQ